MDVLVGLCHEEEDLCYCAMEDLCLIFGEGMACIVITDGDCYNFIDHMGGEDVERQAGWHRCGL